MAKAEESSISALHQLWAQLENQQQASDLASYITGIELNVSGGVELFVF